MGSDDTFPTFEETWQTLSDQLAGEEPRVSDSVRADGDGTSPVTIDALPLLTLTSDDDASELIPQGLLGEGGMGKVELATQRSLGREVAIKSLRQRGSASDAQALLQEAVFTGFLEHPNIVPVHQLGRGTDHRPLLVMKRVEGVSWEDLILDPDHRQWASLGDDRLAVHLAILLAVCNAVEFAHSRKILHRDIKPANVMVGAFGEVYLLDWGLAMRLDDGPRATNVVGTPCQMAPEMLSGAVRVDERTDVYLLGAALHTALTGQPRHPGSSLRDVVRAALVSAPVDYPSSVPEELAALCNASTHVDPRERPASVGAFRRRIAEYQAHRASIELAAEAAEALTALKNSLAGPEPDPERLAGLVAACRFGFTQALRAWPENAVAIDGLQTCLGLVIERQLDRGRLSHAEALLAELPRPAPGLAARVASAREAADARAARLEDLESQGDWRRGARARLGFFAVVVAVVMGLWLWANDFKVRYEGTLSPERLAANVGVAVVVLTAVVVAGRNRLLATQANARLVAGALVGGWAIFLHRLANIIDAPPTAALVSTEIFLCATCSAIGGLTLAPWLWLQVPIWLVGAFAARWIPSYAGLCFATSALLALAVGIWKLSEAAGEPRR